MENKKGKDNEQDQSKPEYSSEANQVVAILLGLLQRADEEVRLTRRIAEAETTTPPTTKAVDDARRNYEQISSSLRTRAFPEDSPSGGLFAPS